MRQDGLTRERVQEAARGAMTVTGVAHRLGLCGKTMSGKTGRILGGLVPGLDDLVKDNREGEGTSPESKCRKSPDTNAKRLPAEFRSL